MIVFRLGLVTSRVSEAYTEHKLKKAIGFYPPIAFIYLYEFESIPFHA